MNFVSFLSCSLVSSASGRASTRSISLMSLDVYSASCACSDGRASFSRARSACLPGTCQDADTCMGGTGMHDMQSQPPRPRRPCSGTSCMGSAPAAACTGHRWGVRHSSRALSVSCLLLLQGVSCARITRARKNRPPA